MKFSSCCQAFILQALQAQQEEKSKDDYFYFGVFCV